MRGILRIGVGSFVAGLAFVAGIAVGQWTPNQQGVNFRSYKAGPYSRIEEATTEVLNTQGDLERWWPVLTGEDVSRTPRDVNWNDERLILVSLGARSSGGYRVFVKSIERKDSNLIVHYVEQKPPAGQAVLTVITSPWELIRMPKTAGNISFDKKIDKGMPIQIIDMSPDCNCTCGRSENGRKGCG